MEKKLQTDFGKNDFISSIRSSFVIFFGFLIFMRFIFCWQFLISRLYFLNLAKRSFFPGLRTFLGVGLRPWTLFSFLYLEVFIFDCGVLGAMGVEVLNSVLRGLLFVREMFATHGLEMTELLLSWFGVKGMKGKPL